MKQVKIHNEVILVGRIMSKQRNLRCNNKKAIRVKLALPNDDNYELTKEKYRGRINTNDAAIYGNKSTI